MNSQEEILLNTEGFIVGRGVGVGSKEGVEVVGIHNYGFTCNLL